MTKEELFRNLKAEILKTPRIIEAFKAIDRMAFVLPDYHALAYADTALPIGHEATISQPYTVAFMLEKLQPMPGNIVLDVGSGSGWTSALLAHIVGPKGKVTATEIIPELVQFGKQNAAKYRFSHLEFARASDGPGFAARAPFDCILVSAAADHLPQELVDQLKPGGRLLIPIHNSIWKIQKTPDGRVEKEETPGFVFVPLHISRQ